MECGSSNKIQLMMCLCSLAFVNSIHASRANAFLLTNRPRQTIDLGVLCAVVDSWQSRFAIGKDAFIENSF